MSQHLHQNDGPAVPFQHDSQLQFFPPEANNSSSTVGCSQSSPKNNPSLSDPAKRSQRRAAPSPLQTTTSATSPSASVTPTRSTFSRSGTKQVSPKDNQETPRSPKERLVDSLASERSLYRSEDSSIDSTRTETQRSLHPIQEPHVTSRSVSDSLLNSEPPLAPSAGPRIPMAATAPKHRVEMGRAAPPRTSSIDSAMSNTSATSTSQVSASESIGSSPDIGNLIQSAGSPEAVIQYLLKEKQSQAAQNSQLWRLVDKQRAMILGLNKDLERALKDKERYRKKLKDTLAQLSNPSPVDSNQGVPSEVGSISSNNVLAARVDSAMGLREAVAQDEPHSPINVALAPYPITPPADHMVVQTPGLSNMVEAEHKMPSPTKHAFLQYNPDAPVAGFEAGQQQRKETDVARQMPYNASVPPSRSLPSDPPKGPPPKASPPRASSPENMALPSVSVIEASPNPDENLKVFPAPPPPRKAPPAPLNLGKNNNASSHLRQASGVEESDSDYDDILEVDEIPTFVDRGRRLTREDDDREREALALKQAEMRSLSKKSAKSKSRTLPADSSENSILSISIPSSQRPTVPISPPIASGGAPEGSNAGSLAGVLNASRTASSSGVLSPPLMSPGLPVSPRPTGRGLASQGLLRNTSSHTSITPPPMSPRTMGAFAGAVPLSPRAPRQPISLPPGTSMSISSPPLASPGLQAPNDQSLVKKINGSANSSPFDEKSSQSFSPIKEGIFKGFVTEEYPGLLLPPNALPSIDVRVASSRLRPSRASIMYPKDYIDDPVFTLAVYSRVDGKELWRIEKDSVSLSQLDQTLKQSPTFTARTPDRSLFSGHAPAKVDARRVALDRYLDEILNTQMDTNSALHICKYLSTNTLEPLAEDMNLSGESCIDSPIRLGPGGLPLKNGYLTKRGKNFGGWKARFFVLDGPIFKYYESPGGPHLGTIKLQNSQIGKQQQSENQSPSRGDDDPDNQYRHAFLILEPKRKDSSSLVRHVLCAESDKERDQWVEALVQYVAYQSDDDGGAAAPPARRENIRNGSGNSSNTHSKKKLQPSARQQTLQDVSDDLRGVSYEATKPGNIPHGVRPKDSGTPSPPALNHERDPLAQMPHPQQTKTISAPRNVHSIQDSGIWGNKQNMLAPVAAEDKKQRKRSFFGFGSKPRVSTDSQDTPSNESSTNLTQMAYDQHGPIRPVFGCPLGEAVRFNHPADVNVELPAVVYRCIEYLDAKNAASEEGIFRLSGSNVVIKQLRERFNVEGDVNLITDDQYYDIHAVASLLKLYLRELPSTILTREFHLEFLAVTELHSVEEKISMLNGLVNRLPLVNNNLLRYLAGFLINIINHSDTNKMTVRNVGIVFSPTLNIPAPVFALFLQQYDGIFGQEPDNHDQTIEVNVEAPSPTSENIRSSRNQKFQTLPTPSYEQQTFPESRAPQSFPQSNLLSGFPQQLQQERATGLAPLRPTYETQIRTVGGPEYGDRGGTVAGPAYDQFRDDLMAQRQLGGGNMPSKSKRRESSMFGLSGMGQKKPSSNRLRSDSPVREESFFE
ncbi:hypothetical protein BJ878DRAFT_35744 [Calycina marina]|uniref:Uncharacterized protein n=1 Tax=Calycina marina TaxID=1763456 RepID=A0A9P7ZAD3_9HELO|nr:hypothetical protein BJ878DRAFT_35744 [Calycina marina]